MMLPMRCEHCGRPVLWDTQYRVGPSCRDCADAGAKAAIITLAIVGSLIVGVAAAILMRATGVLP